MTDTPDTHDFNRDYTDYVNTLFAIYDGEGNFVVQTAHPGAASSVDKLQAKVPNGSRLTTDVKAAIKAWAKEQFPDREDDLGRHLDLYGEDHTVVIHQGSHSDAMYNMTLACLSYHGVASSPMNGGRPGELLARTRAVIDKHNGVVTKELQDELIALFQELLIAPHGLLLSRLRDLPLGSAISVH